MLLDIVDLFEIEMYINHNRLALISERLIGPRLEKACVLFQTSQEFILAFTSALLHS